MIESCRIIVGQANETDATELLPLLRPYLVDERVASPVCRVVNKRRNQGRSQIEPLASESR